MIRFLNGYYVIKLIGADPLRVLNLFAEQGIGFWQIERQDEMTVLCRIGKKDRARAEQCALRAMCTLTVVQEISAARTFGGLRRRPVLLAGTVLAVALAMVLQSFVWTVEIEGNAKIPTQELRQQLEQVGVHFGAWGPAFDQQSLKFQMMNRVGELAWIGVNRRGGRVTVSVSEREEEPTDLDRRVFTNLVAVRPGILTTVDVYNGFSEVKSGDAVVTGQILVSGMADWTTHTQITRAMGEIFALTLHEQTFCLPAAVQKKCYTGREFRQVSLVFGRKRIKISGNSRISYPSCDKMINRRVCTLPGGYSFPAVLETVIFREYTLEPEKLSASAARQQMTAYSEAYVRSQMIAGTVLSRADTLTEENGIWRLDANLSCEEMIARSRPGALEEYDGTDDQCGAD